MSIGAKVKHEVRSIALVTLYFATWLGLLMLIKVLLLAEYKIEFNKWSMALIGALILAKVVLVLDHVSLGTWVRRRPAWVEVAARTLLYSLGVMVVIVIEHGIEKRHEDGGFINAVGAAFRSSDTPRVAVNIICVSGALLVYNAFAAVRHKLGAGILRRVFLEPLPDEPAQDSARDHSQARETT